MQNISYKLNEFDMLQNEPVVGTYFPDMNSLAQRLVLTQGKR